VFFIHHVAQEIRAVKVLARLGEETRAALERLYPEGLVRKFPDPVRTEEGSRARVILPRPDFDAYVRLALDEIRHHGEGSIQVARRLRFLLEDLLRAAPERRRTELRLQLQAPDADAADGARRTASTTAIARRGSPQGHGP
jgi:uncharacterized membrane protein